MVTLSTASIVKGPQTGASAWPNTATDGFLMLAWTLGVKRTKWAKLEQTGHAAFCRYSAWDYLHWRACKADSILIFHPWSPEKMEIKCGLLHFQGILSGENTWKKQLSMGPHRNQILRNMYNNWFAFSVKAATCVCDYAAGKYRCISSLFLLWTLCKILQMHKPESIRVVLVY